MRPRWIAASKADGTLIWRWRNDPEARRQSFSQARFGLRHSMEWLGEKLLDPRCAILMAVVGRRKLGQARLELIAPAAAQVSISVAPQARGRGLGTWMLSHLPRSVGGKPIRRYVAEIKPGNVASVVAFVKAGFEFSARRRRRGEEACVLEKSLT
ncbi:MAG: GNAT family N-acetyltransferase [Elusimicrobia bacterium]|nr:GNAT family N-acetyltransferase [Elusimicrobiota bacterium]